MGPTDERQVLQNFLVFMDATKCRLLHESSNQIDDAEIETICSKILDICFLIYTKHQDISDLHRIQELIFACVFAYKEKREKHHYPIEQAISYFINKAAVTNQTTENLSLYLACSKNKDIAIRTLLDYSNNDQDFFNFLLRNDESTAERILRILVFLSLYSGLFVINSTMYLAQHHPKYIALIDRYISYTIQRPRFKELPYDTRHILTLALLSLFQKIGNNLITQNENKYELQKLKQLLEFFSILELIYAPDQDENILVHLENNRHRITKDSDYNNVLTVVEILKHPSTSLNLSQHYFFLEEFERAYQIITKDGTLQTMKDFLPFVLGKIFNENNEIVDPRPYAIARNLAEKIYQQDKQFPEAQWLLNRDGFFSDGEQVEQEFNDQVHQPLRTSIIMTGYKLAHLLNLNCLHDRRTRSKEDQEKFDEQFGLVVASNSR